MSEDIIIGTKRYRFVGTVEAPANTTCWVHQNKCRVCFDTIQDDNHTVQIHPCKCTFCKECFMIYLSATRIERNFICTKCNVIIDSYRTINKEYFYTTNGWTTIPNIAITVDVAKTNNDSNKKSNTKQIVQETNASTVEIDENNSDTIKSESKSSSQKLAAPAIPVRIDNEYSNHYEKLTDTIPPLPPHQPPKPLSVQPALAVATAAATNVAKFPALDNNDNANRGKSIEATDTTINNYNDYYIVTTANIATNNTYVTNKDSNESKTNSDNQTPAKRKLSSTTTESTCKKQKTGSSTNKIDYKTTNEYIEELREYYKVHGHSEVPRKENEKLARFAYRVRQGYKKITEDQRKALNELNFQWVKILKKDLIKEKKRAYSVRKTFDERIKDLEEFKTVHGHCNVPYKYEPDRGLGGWCKDIRCGHIKLSQECKKKLNQLGFIWERKTNRFERVWNEKYDKLKVFKKLHGHTKVPTKWEFDLELSEWCNTQRKVNNKKKLRPDRKELLDAIGFSWGPYRLDSRNDFGKNLGNINNNDNDSNNSNTNTNNDDNQDESTNEHNHDDSDDGDDDDDDNDEDYNDDDYNDDNSNKSHGRNSSTTNNNNKYDKDDTKKYNDDNNNIDNVDNDGDDNDDNKKSGPNNSTTTTTTNNNNDQNDTNKKYNNNDDNNDDVGNDGNDNNDDSNISTSLNNNNNDQVVNVIPNNAAYFDVTTERHYSSVRRIV